MLYSLIILCFSILHFVYTRVGLHFNLNICLTWRLCMHTLGILLNQLSHKKNPSYGRHSISLRVRLVAPISIQSKEKNCKKIAEIKSCVTVMCHLSHVTCHLSCVTCRVSPVTCHMSLTSIARATDHPTIDFWLPSNAIPLLGPIQWKTPPYPC